MAALIRFLALLAGVIGFPYPHAAAAPSSVQDLRYGVTLYHYFQKDYYDALSELMVAESRGGILGHGDTGQIMQGGLSLAMGMEKRAVAIFSELLNQPRSPQVRDAAWFYLAKLRYRRGDWSGAGESLNNIGGALAGAMAEEYQALKNNLAIRRAQLAEVAGVLDAKPEMTPWTPYVFYNLAAAHIRTGNQAAGVRYFDRLAGLPLQTEEHLALRDKALTAAGYSLLQQRDYSAAIARFTQVRLNSPLLEQALLGYGWAASENADYALALTPWRTLAQRSQVSANVQEALLAIPYAYERLGAHSQALSAFQTAEQSYTEQLQTINSIRERLQTGDLLAILDQPAGGNVYLQRLTEFMAQQRWQTQLKDLKDLLAVRDRQQAWLDKLEIYSHLLDQREQVRGERLTLIAKRNLPELISALQTQYRQLSEQFAVIEVQQDPIPLADDSIHQLWRRVENAARLIDLLAANGEDTGDYRESLRRYRGLLSWQAAEQFPDNQWRARKALQQLQTEIDTVRQRQLQLNEIIAEAPEIAPYRVRLLALQQRLLDQQQALDNILSQTENHLLALVRQQLQEQMMRLRYYQGHARLSIARLYDLARQQTLETAP